MRTKAAVIFINSQLSSGTFSSTVLGGILHSSDDVLLLINSTNNRASSALLHSNYFPSFRQTILGPSFASNALSLPTYSTQIYTLLIKFPLILIPQLFTTHWPLQDWEWAPVPLPSNTLFGWQSCFKTNHYKIVSLH